MTNIFFLVLTNIVTVVSLPSGLCYDTGIMGASFNTGDTNPVYGIKIDVFNAKNEVISKGWVQESYVPPMTETVPVALTPAAVLARCEIFGPNLDGKWKDAYFFIEVMPPKLNIKLVKGNVVLDWFDPGNCWQLQYTTNGVDWVDSPSTRTATDKMGFFRLVRHYE